VVVPVRRSEWRWLDELPADERELWREAIRAAGPVRHDPPPRPGDWIPLGHVPLTLIPAPDVGPLQTFTAARWRRRR
jgi:hypothetical protein